MHIQVVLMALAALASSQDPFGMELLVMEEIMCDLLRRHPVYRELSLKNVEECHYNIQQFGQDLCVRDPLNFSGSIYGTCFSLHTLRSMLSLKRPKTTTTASPSTTPSTSTFSTTPSTFHTILPTASPSTTPSTSTSTTPSTFSTTPSTFPTILPTALSSSGNNNNNTFTTEPYYITALVIIIVILFSALVAYKFKHPAVAVNPPAVNIFLHAFNTLSNFVTTNTVSQATANFVRNLSNHITGLYPTAQTAPPPPSSSSQNNNSNLDNSTAISILNTPARRQSVDSSLSHPSPNSSHSTSGNSSLTSTPNHPSTSITIDNSSHSVRFHRYNLRSTPLRNN
jgi:hypothetical protein